MREREREREMVEGRVTDKTREEGWRELRERKLRRKKDTEEMGGNGGRDVTAWR